MILKKEKFKKNRLAVICIVLLTVTLLAFVCTGRTFGNQAKSAMYPKMKFCGQVKVADGEWKPYVKGEHIPANEGDVTLKGNFELFAPDTEENLGRPEQGMRIVFYLNHIGGGISEDNGEIHRFDTELDIAAEEMCGIMYIVYGYKGGEEVNITLKNPHKFGNTRAVDEFLDNLCIYGGVNFEKDTLNRGSTQRTLGIVFVLSAFVILGTAVFSMLIHIKSSVNIWLIGFAVFFSGLYFIFNAHGVMYFSEIIKFNTRVLGGAQMLYMLSITAFVVLMMRRKNKKTAKALLVFLTVADALIFIISMLTDIKFFDMWFLWTAIQSFVCFAILGMLVYNIFVGEKNEKFRCALEILPMLAFLVDVAGIYFGLWNGGFISGCVFIFLFLVALVMLLKVIPQNINAAIKAKELEAEKKILKAELAESRIATMISQIQPHFIYNTLGTIEQLCISEPDAASKLVHNFSLYLRGNFSELDNIKPIRFSQEMNHVKHYTDIEQVRFPDMTIQYDLRSVEFFLPALSVQPLVENAIKHGLMGLEEGGIVTISAYETEECYVVEVKDDGVGFDSDAGYDETKHVGIKNIRGRIEAMCGGTLSVESKIGEGTKATIKIPRGSGENGSNNC